MTEDRAARQLRRQERREKQRGANLLRVEKMHALRLEAETLKKSTKKNSLSPAKSDQSAPSRDRRDQKRQAYPEIHIGCSGWFYWHWKGLFYPENLKTREWFAHYAKRFKTCELNAPFYSWPTAGTVGMWKTQIGRKPFRYTVKVCELITHIKKFRAVKTLIRDFQFIADLLGPSMGCFLFQLPPSFHYSPARLNLILTQLDHRQRNVLEFRHASWWNEKVFSALKRHGTVFCSTSAPKLPDDLVVTADDVYIRFHGTKSWYRHDYGADELSAWADRIKASGAKRVWAYFNNDFEGHALKNAHDFAKLLRR